MGYMYMLLESNMARKKTDDHKIKETKWNTKQVMTITAINNKTKITNYGVTAF
jgi:hypothetical protein